MRGPELGGAVEQVVIDDAQVGAFHHVPLVTRLLTCHELARARSALGGGLSPDLLTQIAFVAEDATNMMFRPRGAARRRHGRGFQAVHRSLPTFEVDGAWPTMPAEWKLGDPSSVAIDAQDNVWVLHRPRTLPPDQAGMTAPPVIVFNTAGNFIKAWGGAGNGYEWPEREHGLHIDYEGFVWLGGINCPTNGQPGVRPVADDQLLKFTQDGEFVLQIGRSNQSKGNADTATSTGRRTSGSIHRQTNCLWLTATAITVSPCSMHIPGDSNGCGGHSATSR